MKRRFFAAFACIALGLVAALSFACCLCWMQPHPKVNFYAPVSRAWELLLGALAAHARWAGFARRGFNECAAWLALGVLLLSYACFDADSAHPGLITLLPCAAALTLLVAHIRRGRGQAAKTA